MTNGVIEMAGECTSSYSVKEHDDGKITITIEVPKRFADLWLVKLSELRTTDAEIREYETPVRQVQSCPKSQN